MQNFYPEKFCESSPWGATPFEDVGHGERRGRDETPQKKSDIREAEKKRRHTKATNAPQLPDSARPVQAPGRVEYTRSSSAAWGTPTCDDDSFATAQRWPALGLYLYGLWCLTLA